MTDTLLAIIAGLLAYNVVLTHGFGKEGTSGWKLIKSLGIVLMLAFIFYAIAGSLN